jgi:hypothetical protein
MNDKSRIFKEMWCFIPLAEKEKEKNVSALRK